MHKPHMMQHHKGHKKDAAHKSHMKHKHEAVHAHDKVTHNAVNQAAAQAATHASHDFKGAVKKGHNKHHVAHKQHQAQHHHKGQHQHKVHAKHPQH